MLSKERPVAFKHVRRFVFVREIHSSNDNIAVTDPYVSVSQPASAHPSTLRRWCR